jgi:predicted dehydrogenase
MPDKIRWGVVGSCGIARRRTIPEGIVPASNAQLTGVFNRSQEGNLEVARTYQAEAFASLEELLSSNVDAIYIATPVDVHFQQVTQSLQAGKHVLCEKPLALTMTEAEQMESLARQRGLQLGVAFMMRFQSQHREALKIIQSGQLGKPVYGRAQLSCWYPPLPNAWRQNPSQGGGGSLADMGVHCIDLLEMFLGPAVSVSCRIANSVHEYRSEDSAVISLAFKNGALGTVDSFFCIPDKSSQNILELYGSEGSILAKGTIGQDSQGEMVLYSQSSEQGYDAQQHRDTAGGVKISPAPVNIYRAEIEEFSQSILDGKPSSMAGGEGLRSQRTLEACYASAKSHCTVNVGAA